MRYLFLIAGIFCCSHFANAQGAHFHRYKTVGWVDYFSFSEVDQSGRFSLHISVSDKVFFTVSSKGDKVLTLTYDLDPLKYDEFLKSLKACNIKRKPSKKSDACTAGVEQGFKIKARINKAGFKFNSKVTGVRNKCNGYDYTDLEGDLDKMIQAFKLLVPDYDAKIDSIKTAK